MAIPLFFLGHWYASLFAQTFFLHRYAAHGMFRLSKFWERVFYICTYIIQGSSFLNPRAYAIMHRLHHAHSDTPEDPHSPVVHPNIFKMMWRTANLYNDYVYERVQISKEIMRGYVPKLSTWFERFAESWVSRVSWGALYVLFYIYFAGDSWWWYLLLPIHFLMGPVHGAIVNYFGHKLGYTNFKNGDNSKNTLAFDFVTLGELFQNNHHKFPLRLNFATKWFEIDPVYWIIRGMNAIGIVKIKRTQSAVASVEKKEAGLSMPATVTLAENTEEAQN